MFEKILVPLDGSEHSMCALEKAVQIAKKFDGKITLIHVYSFSSFVITPTQPFAITPTQVRKYVHAIRKYGASIIVDGEKKVKAEAKGIKVETVLRVGHAVNEIVDEARDGKYDLIVMGARGKSKIREILMGSVSHNVTRHAPCPVLIVR